MLLVKCFYYKNIGLKNINPPLCLLQDYPHLDNDHNGNNSSNFTACVLAWLGADNISKILKSFVSNYTNSNKVTDNI